MHHKPPPARRRRPEVPQWHCSGSGVGPAVGAEEEEEEGESGEGRIERETEGALPVQGESAGAEVSGGSMRGVDRLQMSADALERINARKDLTVL